MESCVVLERIGRIVKLSLDRPTKLNAITAQMNMELVSILDDLNPTSTSALILTGNGAGFCAGADLSDLDKMRDSDTAIERLAQLELAQELSKRLRNAPFATIAAVNGVAAGGGISIALACDVVLASSDSRLVWAFLDRGLTPDAGLTDRLRDMLGSRRAVSLLFRTTELSPAEAQKLGLVDEVCAPEDLLPRAFAVGERIMSGGSAVVPLMKRTLGSAGMLSQTVEALAQVIALSEGKASS